MGRRAREGISFSCLTPLLHGPAGFNGIVTLVKAQDFQCVGDACKLAWEPE